MDEWLRLAREAGVQDACAQPVRRPQLTRIAGGFRRRPVELIREQVGDGVRTAVRAIFEPPLDLGLEARPSALARVTTDGIGHVHLDEEYAVRVDEASRARSLFGHGLGDRVYALHCACSSPTLTDDFVEVSEEWLRGSLEVAADLVDLVEAARQLIPPPASLSAHLEPLRALSARLEVPLSLAPFRVVGAFDQLVLEVRATRTGHRRHELELTLRRPEPLGVGLLVTPTQALLDTVRVWFGGQDVLVNEPVFDAAYRIRVGLGREAALALALDEETRSILLAVRERGAELTLDDDGACARYRADADPDALPASIEPLAEALRRIERSLRLDGRTPSPYR